MKRNILLAIFCLCTLTPAFAYWDFMWSGQRIRGFCVLDTEEGKECKSGLVNYLSLLPLPDGQKYAGNIRIVSSIKFGYQGSGSVSSEARLKYIEYRAFDGSPHLTSVTFPTHAEFKLINGEAFRNCTGLTSLTIPCNVKYIRYGAFQGCSNLATVTFAKQVGGENPNLEQDAFNSCTSLRSIDFSQVCLTSIGQAAFAGCSSLKHATISSCTSVIGDYAFSGCSSLTHFTQLPGTGTTVSVGNYVFQNCSSLKYITLSPEIATLKSGTFQNCRSLTTLTIPKNGVVEIAYADRDIFNGINLSNVTLCVPANYVAAYKNANLWRSFSSIYAIPTGINIDQSATAPRYLPVYATMQLSATVLPTGDNGASQKVTWTSSDPAIATVTDDGLVTARTVGKEVTITATSIDDKLTATHTITTDPNWYAVNEMKRAIESSVWRPTDPKLAHWTVNMAIANDENTVRTWIASRVHDLHEAADANIEINSITINSFLQAVRGVRLNPAGVPGSFNFTVNIRKGTYATVEATREGSIEPLSGSAVTTGTFAYGRVTPNATPAFAGETVTLTGAPNAGYELDAIYANCDDSLAIVQYRRGPGGAEPETVYAYRTSGINKIVPISGTGNTRTFMMPAFPVTVTATFKKTQATLEADDVNAAKGLIEAASLTFSQKDANTERGAMTYLAGKIKDIPGISGTGINPVTAADINVVSFSAAIPGTTDRPNGTNGSITFTVDLSKGSAQKTTANKTVGITAAHVTQAVVIAARDAISGVSEWTVPQELAGNEADVENWLSELIPVLWGDPLATQVTIKEITISNFNGAIDGTVNNPDGTSGSFTAKIDIRHTLSGYAQNGFETETVNNGIITAAPYVLQASVNLISPSSEDMTVNESVALVAIVLPDEATNKSVIWTANSPSAVELKFDADTCIVTAKSKGTFTITAMAEDNVNVKVERSFNVWEKGDANGNGMVTTSDINLIVNHLLGKTPKRFIIQAADFNSNGRVTTSDINLIVNYLLRK